MAEKRMFTVKIIESDAFLDMPNDAKVLYFYLNSNADDDGFCDSPRKVMRMCGASDDAMKILIAKKFVLTFTKNDTFVVVIKHWRMHNTIRRDTYHETKYKEFMRELYYDENNSYSLNSEENHKPCLPCAEPVTNPSRTRDEDVHDTATQIRLDKIRLEQISLDKNRKGDSKGETVCESQPAADDSSSSKSKIPDRENDPLGYWAYLANFELAHGGRSLDGYISKAKSQNVEIVIREDPNTGNKTAQARFI